MNAMTGAACMAALVLGVALGYALAPGADLSRSIPVADALAEQDLLTRSGMLAAALENLDAGNLDEALAALDAKQVGVTDTELRVFMLAWARFDAAGAYAWAAAQESEWSGRLQEAAAYAWGYADPQAAIEILSDTPTGRSGRSPLTAALMAGWRVNGDVSGMTEQIIAIPPSRQRETLTTALLAQIGKQGLDPVVAWLEGIPVDAEADYKRLAFVRTMAAVARRDVQRATELYLVHQGQPYTENALGVLARRWIDHDEPATLFPWLAELPAPQGQTVDPEQSRALSQGMKWWLRRNPDEAQAWVNGFDPLPVVYDPAVGSLAQYYLKEHPNLAAYWATQVRDEALRSETLVRAMKRWMRKDPEAAQEWLATAEIDPETLKRINLSGGKGMPKGRRGSGGRPRQRPR